MKKRESRTLTECETTEPCPAVLLLMKRMDSNPDEFHLKRGGKWADVLNLCRQRITGTGDDKLHLIVLQDFEINMIWNKFMETGRNELNKEFMRRILLSGEQED